MVKEGENNSLASIKPKVLFDQVISAGHTNKITCPRRKKTEDVKGEDIIPTRAEALGRAIASENREYHKDTLVEEIHYWNKDE